MAVYGVITQDQHQRDRGITTWCPYHGNSGQSSSIRIEVLTAPRPEFVCAVRDCRLPLDTQGSFPPPSWWEGALAPLSQDAACGCSVMSVSGSGGGSVGSSVDPRGAVWQYRVKCDTHQAMCEVCGNMVKNDVVCKCQQVLTTMKGINLKTIPLHVLQRLIQAAKGINVQKHVRT